MKYKIRSFPFMSERSAAVPPGTEPSLRAAVHTPGPGYRSFGEEGQSLAEFALVVPVLLLTGIFSFGIIFNQYEVLTNSTNSAARAFALSANGAAATTSTAPNQDPCAYVKTIVQQDSPNLSSASLNYTINYTVTATNTKTTYNNPPTCAGISMTQGDVVTVTVTYPVTTSLYGWATRNLTLTASSTELVQ
jgi:Flp pilus assembly protein TadG